MDRTAKVEAPEGFRQPVDSSARFQQEYQGLNEPEKPESEVKDSGDSTKKLTRGEENFDSIARDNGLDIKETPQGKLEFSLQYNGEKLVIGKFENTKDGVKELQKSLKEFSELKRWQLENSHNIKIARPGDPAPKQQIGGMDGPPREGKELALREPKLKELLGLEAALEKANPSHRTGDRNRPMKFYFLKDGPYNTAAGGSGTFEPNLHGGPAVIIEANSLDNSPITEKDRSDDGTADHQSIESLFIHELGHHSEERLMKTPRERLATYKRVGWVPIPGTRPEELQLMLKGKDGGFAPAGLDPEGKWEKFDKNGNMVGLVSPEEVAKQALIKPSTNYFEGPHEMLTEAVTMLRLGDNHRTQLMQRDRRLYDVARDFDQKEIDLNYGKGKFMRSYSGKVVPRTAENEQALRRKEGA